MTELKRPLSRETRAHRHEQGKTRAIIVTLDGRMIGFRLKLTRTTYWLDVEGEYCRAVRLTEAQKQRERKSRKAKR